MAPQVTLASEEKSHHKAHEAHEGVGAKANDASRIVIDAGLKVHKTLGPGLLESVYEHCLVYELQSRGVSLQRQVALPVRYGDVVIDAGYRLDLVIEEALVVEIKAVESMTRLHEAQIMTYLRCSGFRVGLLMNFNVPLFKQGIRRLVL